MATPSTTNSAKRRTSTAKGQARRTARQTKTTAKTTTTASKSQVQRVAETVVDVPVGAALRVAERVQELFEPWTSRGTAERELRSYRTQLTRTINRSGSPRRDRPPPGQHPGQADADHRRSPGAQGRA